MKTQTTLLDDDVITRESPAYKSLIAQLRTIEQTADTLQKNQKPSILSERYFTTEQLMERFHLSRRTLQNYRDQGILAYTSIGGTLLYPESQLEEILSRNLIRPL